jgi:hypothetical protein
MIGANAETAREPHEKNASSICFGGRDFFALLKRSTRKRRSDPAAEYQRTN